MARELELQSWPRRRHFEFFRDYDQPFFGVCVEMDVSEIYRASRGAGTPSFLVLALYLSLKVANETEPFRYRLKGDAVVVHDVIHGGTIVLRADETFAFAYFSFHEDFAAFHEEATREMRRVESSLGELQPSTNRDDLIHYSVLPWIAFTGVLHARRREPSDSVPKIVFGKHHDRDGKRVMPVSVECHHSLMDGLHMGRYIERFQSLLETPPSL